MIKNIAVTGTKGKSTVLRLLEAGFTNLNYNVYGSYGIDGYFYRGTQVRDGDSCQDYINWNKRAMPADVHLVEATSFILDQNYLDNFNADCVLFTSFDKTEHKEIHPKEGSYLKSKKKIFKLLKPDCKAVICRDIEDFQEIVKDIECDFVTYGFHPESDYVISINMLTNKKMVFSVEFQGEALFFKTRLLGRFNASNIAAAFACSVEMNLERVKFFRGLESFTGFPGRLERYYIPETNNNIIIDYAHTFHSLRELLQLCKEVYDGDLVTIFGCGGDKSKEKRKLMGQTSEQHSNYTIITNDNPRSEPPMDIAMEILQGFSDDKKAHIILNRAQAITTTLTNCRNTTIVIAGKGNEHYIRLENVEIFHIDKICLEEWCLQNNLTLINMCQGGNNEY